VFAEKGFVIEAFADAVNPAPAQRDVQSLRAGDGRLTGGLLVDPQPISVSRDVRAVLLNAASLWG
jgi:hypothetical protein